MTPSEKRLVRSSYITVEKMADTVAAMFYEELFSREPRLRELFKNDMADQRKKLMMMLATAVAHLHDWETISSAVRGLGQRHRGYGVSPADYDTVASALLTTLERTLGPDQFTTEVRAAWHTCISEIAAEMLTETAA